MIDGSSRSAEYDRGFTDGYEEGRRSKRGLGFILGILLLLFVLGTVVVNLFTPRMAGAAGGSAEAIQLPSHGPNPR